MKTLLLMRHGKSDWDTSYDTDHERPLNGRGARSARIMGRYLAAHNQVPDLVISSTAVRAKATAELAIEAGAWGTELRVERRLYDTGPIGVRQVASETTDAGRVMMVGHQPTWSLLIEILTQSTVAMKTANVAAIDLPIENWADIDWANGSLTSLISPRDLFGSEWDDR